MSTLTSLIDEKTSRMAEQVDGITGETAGGLHSAASSIRDAAGTAARRLDEAGGFVEKQDLKSVLVKSRLFVRRHPAELAAVAAGLGFLSGLAVITLTRFCVKPSASA